MKIIRNLADKNYITVSGPIGGRKTSYAVLLTQYLEENNLCEMPQRLEKIRDITAFLDYGLINKWLEDNFNSSIIYLKDDLLELAEKCLTETGLIYTLKEKHFILNDSSFEVTSLYKILAEYIEIRYYLLFRKSHVMSNTTVVSVNTGRTSLPLKESLYMLYRPNNVALEKYMIHLEDESGIVNNSRQYAKLDKENQKENTDGKDVFTMLIRHLGEGKITKIAVVQQLEDFTAAQRRLSQLYIDSIIGEEVTVYEFEINIFKMIINWLKSREFKKYNKKMKLVKQYSFLKNDNKARKIFYKYQNYLDQDNFYKKIIRSIHSVITKLNRIKFISQLVFIHQKVDDVGKEIKENDKRKTSYVLDGIYNANTVYGLYDTYAYSDLRNIRNDNAIESMATREPFKNNKMNKEELERMDYKMINKILHSISNENEGATEDDF